MLLFPKLCRICFGFLIMLLYIFYWLRVLWVLSRINNNDMMMTAMIIQRRIDYTKAKKWSEVVLQGLLGFLPISFLFYSCFRYLIKSDTQIKLGFVCYKKKLLLLKGWMGASFLILLKHTQKSYSLKVYKRN